MKTASTIPSAVAAFEAFEALGAGLEAAPRASEASAPMGKLRKALTDATEWLMGTDPEVDRTHFLSQATDAADLELRIQAWERAQETRRTLPQVL